MAHKHLICDILERIVHDQLVLICAKDNSNRLCIPFRIHLLPIIIQIEIHLTNVFMKNFSALQINQHKAFQNPVIKNQIDLIGSSAYNHLLLSANIGEPFPEFKEKQAQIVYQRFFQVPLLIDRQLRKSCEFEYIRLFQDVLRTFYNLPFSGQSQDLLLICAEGKSVKEHTLHLTFQFPDAPMLTF